MSLKLTWTPKVNGVDDVDADDINNIADTVIVNETKIENLQRNSETVNENIQTLTESVNTNADDIVDLKEIVEELQESGGGTGGGGTGGEITQDVTSAILLAMYNEVDVAPMDEGLFLFDDETATITGFDYSTEDKWNALNNTDIYIIPYSINGVLVKNVANLKGLNPKTIRLPNSILRIEDEAFSGIISLRSINIPTSCEYIGVGAFSLTPLKEVITPIKPNWEIVYGERAFEGTGSLNNIDTIIDGIKSIPKKAFYHCDALKAVTIPESVDIVESEAFGRCESLRMLTMLNPNVVLEYGFCDENVIIKGYSNSTAEEYALTYGHPFIGIDAIYYDGTEVAL